MSWTEEEQDKKESQAVSSSSLQAEEHKPVDNTDAKLWQLLEKTLSDTVVEKRRARRWKIFFRFTTLFFIAAVIGVATVQMTPSTAGLDKDTVAIIPMRGVIGSGADIEASDYLQLLDEAYRRHNLTGVVIEMNSPGGSPVHAGIIYDAIRQKESLYPNIPVIVVVEDLAASGGYYIASAANEIYADKASLVGSIGVISAGWDASELLDKIGVERRTFTAGRNKDFLDPFVPMSKEGKEKWQAVLDETHQQFIHAVKVGRGERLTITDDVFSGMVFTGAQAEQIGLIDGLSSAHNLLKTRFANATPIVFAPEHDPWEKVAKEFGVQFATKILTSFSLH
ncbi:S49 family peptidase [Marinomonas pollencensis]|uniref:Protease-4 n=1 Tax=Marinomonas pollencensis TaxID=491954 RepID=A0A3E0DRF0_9GAMM|nr:S49 family peptidase [Marinomonas pollencensis]REG85715.1 protease-4 [Marinomonas pollencensis]